MTESKVCRTEHANPAQSIQPLVRKTNLKIEKALSSGLSIQKRKQDFEIRDLYNRKEKLANWILE